MITNEMKAINLIQEAVINIFEAKKAMGENLAGDDELFHARSDLVLAVRKIDASVPRPTRMELEK